REVGKGDEKVLREADVPVVIIPDPKPYPSQSLELKKILLPLDGSDLAESAFASVEPLARIPGMEIVLLHVEPPKDTNPFAGGRGPLHRNGHHRADVDSYTASVSRRLTALGASVSVVIREGPPGLEIVDAAEDSVVDMIVMSSHGRTGLSEWAFGSTADQVLRLSTVPVFLIRAQTAVATPEHLRASLVFRCHHCGLRSAKTSLSAEMRCARCKNLLKTCGNCVHSDGLFCLIQQPEATGAYPGNSCKKFEFRKTPVMLH
ncbi:MAG: universal stress protein, partial [Chloroflexi bacterium]|nr:universal stress protein [Chloroflexota bacterium]